MTTIQDSAAQTYQEHLRLHDKLARGILLAHEPLYGLPPGADRDAAIRNFIRAIDALKQAADDLAKEAAWNAMTK